MYQNKLIKYLAFDIDGTIFSSEEIILEVYEEAIKLFKQKSGLSVPIPSKVKLMAQIGKPVKTIFLNLLPELPDYQRDEISESVLNLLCSRIQNGEGILYPGVTETLKDLYDAGYVFLTASNGRLPYITSILQVAMVEKYFSQLITLDYKSLHTKGDILNYYIDYYREKPERFLMIGDRFSDFEAARSTGVPFLFCEYGHAEEGEIPEYYKKIESLTDLKKILINS